MNGLKNTSDIGVKLTDLNQLILIRFSELKEAVTPTSYIILNNTDQTVSEEMFLNKRATLFLKLSGVGSLSVKIDGTTALSVNQNTQTVSLNITQEKGIHTFDFCPTGTVSAKIMIKGGSISENL